MNTPGETPASEVVSEADKKRDATGELSELDNEKALQRLEQVLGRDVVQLLMLQQDILDAHGLRTRIRIEAIKKEILGITNHQDLKLDKLPSFVNL